MARGGSMTLPECQALTTIGLAPRHPLLDGELEMFLPVVDDPLRPRDVIDLPVIWIAVVTEATDAVLSGDPSDPLGARIWVYENVWKDSEAGTLSALVRPSATSRHEFNPLSPTSLSPTIGRHATSGFVEAWGYDTETRKTGMHVRTGWRAGPTVGQGNGFVLTSSYDYDPAREDLVATVRRDRVAGSTGARDRSRVDAQV